MIAGLVWVVLTVLGEVFVQLFATGGFPRVAAEEGRVADDAILALLRIVVPIFTFVVVVVVYSMLRFRAPAGDSADAAVQARDDRRFSLSWLGATSVLAVLLTVWPGVTGLRAIWAAGDAEDPLVVEVTARQWEWEFSYPRQGVARMEELVLPVDRPVRFVLTSEDVIHSFWVPAFRIKEDIVPGETRDLFLTPDRTISTAVSPLARVQCAELCGIGHAEMRATVRVVRPQQFAAWIQEMKS